MKGVVFFLAVLSIGFLVMTANQAEGVELVTPTPTTKIPGNPAPDVTATPEPTPTVIVKELPKHFWTPSVGTRYENHLLQGVGNRFTVDEPLLHLVFAYTDMEDDLDYSVWIYRDGARYGGADLVWDAGWRGTEGILALDLWSFVPRRQPGTYTVELWVAGQREQALTLELVQS
jgi:hypothetical protein